MPETDRHNEIVSELTLLRDAAREAGRIAMRYFGRSPEVWLKDGSSPVSEADLAVDRYLKDVLLKARPDYGWISEETVDERAAENAAAPSLSIRLTAPVHTSLDRINGVLA